MSAARILRGLLGVDRPLESRDHAERTGALISARAEHEAAHDRRVADARRQIAEAAQARDAAIRADHACAAATHARLDHELALEAARELGTLVESWRTGTSIASATNLATTLRRLDERARIELGEGLAPEVLLAAFAPSGANLSAIADRQAFSRAGEGDVPRYRAAEVLASLDQPARAFDLLARLDLACAAPQPMQARDEDRDRAHREHAVASTLRAALEAIERDRRGQPPLVPAFAEHGSTMRDPSTGRVVGYRGSVEHPPDVEHDDGTAVRDPRTGRVIAYLNRE